MHKILHASEVLNQPIDFAQTQSRGVDATCSTFHIIFTDTYMPPTYPLDLAIPPCSNSSVEIPKSLPIVQSQVCGCTFGDISSIVCLYDLGEGGHQKLFTFVNQFPSAFESGTYFVVAPSFLNLEAEGSKQVDLDRMVELELVDSAGPHISSEHLGDLLNALRQRGATSLSSLIRLNIYSLTF